MKIAIINGRNCKAVCNHAHGICSCKGWTCEISTAYINLDTLQKYALLRR